jgi:hypothetical protein
MGVSVKIGYRLLAGVAIDKQAGSGDAVCFKCLKNSLIAPYICTKVVGSDSQAFGTHSDISCRWMRKWGLPILILSIDLS